MQTLLPIALITHIVGITIMAGTTLVEYLLTKHFWKLYKRDSVSAIGVHDSGFNFHMVVDIGVILLILSGITMLVIFQDVFIHQIWFQIKIGLIVLIAINGSVIGRGQDKKLKKLMAQEKSSHSRFEGSGEINLHEQFLNLKRRLDLFYLSQLFMFLTVFTLSIFKFN